jgi:undecaprenyl-phosphate 4-deoxy-4-formamido-L-arabinose transferase
MTTVERSEPTTSISPPRLKTVSVVVPVYNAAATLVELVERLEAVLTRVADDYEILLVNDGSRDASWQLLAQLVSRNPRLRAFDLLRNYGQHNALLLGIREARGEVIVTIDDDLQHPPEEIPRLLGAIVDGYDVVYGSPRQEQHDIWRVTASRLTKLALQDALGVDAARNVSAFRAFRTEIRTAFASYQGPWVSIDILLSWGAQRFSSVPVAHSPRTEGKSNYTFRKLVRHAVDMITGFSTWPLRFASFVGFLFTVFGLIVLAYVLIRYLTVQHHVAGFAFLASIVAIFGGVQLFALGVMGEYLARMHIRMMDRPSFAVREQIGGGLEPPSQ